MEKSTEQFGSIQNHLKNALFLKQQLKFEETRRKQVEWKVEVMQWVNFLFFSPNFCLLLYAISKGIVRKERKCNKLVYLIPSFPFAQQLKARELII